ncbi:hypothetical protein [Arthrobacter woluwensis]|uniref:hypothetical protein n=1 Tax=Arthrobacter woluwensis TaxID=156980 RepID=UPI0015E7A029|nr:hypothetical protein [Arthrobacter woluwensis]
MIAATIAAPAASASPAANWNLHVEAVCADASWFRETAGFKISNTGTEPIPAGTIFTWTQQLHIEGSLILPPGQYDSRKRWVQNTIIWNETISSQAVTTSSWSPWEEVVPTFGYKYGDRTRVVTYIVPEGGLAPGEAVYLGTKATSFRRGFWMSLTFTSGNGGSVEGDESARLGSEGWLITGCAEQEDSLDNLTPEELKEATAEAERIQAEQKGGTSK